MNLIIIPLNPIEFLIVIALLMFLKFIFNILLPNIPSLKRKILLLCCVYIYYKLIIINLVLIF